MDRTGRRGYNRRRCLVHTARTRLVSDTLIEFGMFPRGEKVSDTFAKLGALPAFGTSVRHQHTEPGTVRFFV
jgi:hypothetical protein